MKKKQNYRYNYFGFDTDKLKLLGQGHEGKVYLLPDDKVIKVFHNPEACRRQLEILLSARESRFFPTVYDFDACSIVMSFVYGCTLSYYLKKNYIDKHLSFELVKLYEEFKRLKFAKLDMRLGHIYLQPDENIKIIDPRKSYDLVVPYPRSMLEGLKKYGALKDFYNYIKKDYHEYYKSWKGKIL